MSLAEAPPKDRRARGAKSYKQDGATVIVRGEVERATGDAWWSPLGRFPFILAIRGAERLEVVECEGVGVVPIERVTYDASHHVLELVGGIPGHI
jgi:hypothetical protein